MKKTITISCLVAACSFLLAGFITNSDKDNTLTGRTEEYAIVDVLDYGRRKVIRVTVGEELTQEKEWEKTKTEIDPDFTSAIKDLNLLNAKGFEIVNSSLTYISPSLANGNAASAGCARSIFLLRRKL
ncbi:MAG: hypothetical protein ACTHJT_02605 [Cytophaga sp.]|uniref:hypothetical protein n=1 Tax=Cytophaga sp. TaxID=29535 RepID=UPI003F7E3607